MRLSAKGTPRSGGRSHSHAGQGENTRSLQRSDFKRTAVFSTRTYIGTYLGTYAHSWWQITQPTLAFQGPMALHKDYSWALLRLLEKAAKEPEQPSVIVSHPERLAAPDIDNLDQRAAKRCLVDNACHNLARPEPGRLRSPILASPARPSRSITTYLPAYLSSHCSLTFISPPRHIAMSAEGSVGGGYTADFKYTTRKEQPYRGGPRQTP
ncbi:hypothetical protein F4778DRAFT_164585 [Xylariomycetidae sp. FL2044]|nr:hypothetical protein F4778DRAFT_164585 [Xylariomycetidae sp. FL2044]